MWNQVLQLMFAALNWLYGYAHDYGLAILLLTVALRVLIMPLTIKQTRSMYELQRIQPKIKELQEKHKDDKEKLQSETMRFYEENKVNPFGGCLPLLLQMPIFIALFNVLNKLLPEYLKNNPGISKAFWLILPDITKSPEMMWKGAGWIAAIPYVVLVVLFGLSVWLPQQLTPGADKQQKNMSLYMGAMMVFFGWKSPAGVLIYWVSSSAWQLAQQAILNRTMKKDDALAPVSSPKTGADKPAAKGPGADGIERPSEGAQSKKAGSTKRKKK